MRPWHTLLCLAVTGLATSAAAQSAATPAAGLNEDAVQKLRELVAQTQLEVPGVNVGITGEPVLEFDEHGKFVQV